jgi:hypothetical protein
MSKTAVTDIINTSGAQIKNQAGNLINSYASKLPINPADALSAGKSLVGGAINANNVVGGLKNLPADLTSGLKNVAGDITGKAKGAIADAKGQIDNAKDLFKKSVPQLKKPKKFNAKKLPIEPQFKKSMDIQAAKDKLNSLQNSATSQLDKLNSLKDKAGESLNQLNSLKDRAKEAMEASKKLRDSAINSIPKIN